MSQDSSAHILLLSLLIFITINLFVLDLKVFAPSQIRLSDIATQVTVTPIPDKNSLSCPASCVTLIENVQPKLNEDSPVGLSPPKSVQTQTSVTREYYVPLGSGSTQSTNWDDLTSTDTLIDPALYPTMKEAYFIVALSNPTQNGQIEAQLYNVTDKHVVWNSHVSMNGPSAQTITAGPIALVAGPKLYRVQLKSGLSYPSSVTSAKIRIVSLQ